MIRCDPVDVVTPQVVWFAWRDLSSAYELARVGGIALHVFRHDLRRFGLGHNERACHIISAHREGLVAFAARFGLRAAWIEPPRHQRPDIWHFDAFGAVLARLVATYPPPAHVSWPQPSLATGASGRGAVGPGH